MHNSFTSLESLVNLYSDLKLDTKFYDNLIKLTQKSIMQSNNLIDFLQKKSL